MKFTRGKEQNRRAVLMGTISLVSMEYEHVTVNELQYADENRNTITLTFRDPNCP